MRFSFDHVPEPPRRGFWLHVGMVFIFLAIPVAALNLAVDPFDFRLVPHLKLARENIMRKNDTMLWVAGELRRIPSAALDKVTLAVVGDSRTDTLCRWPSSPRIFKLGGDYVINLSVGGSSIGENIKLLDAELPRLPNLKAVLFAAPIERVGPAGNDRAGNALRLANHPMLYALSLGTLAWSIDLLRERLTKNTPAEDRPDIDPARIADTGAAGLDVAGSLKKTGKDTPFSKSEQAVAASWKVTISKIDPDRLRQRTHALLEPLAVRLRDRGIQLVFFFPPLHPSVTNGIELKIAELQRPFVIDLTRLGTVEDFSLGNRSGIQPVFSDSMHLQQDIAHAVLADIYLRNFAKPSP